MQDGIASQAVWTDARVILRGGGASRIAGGHPWVFEGMIDRVEGEVTDGAQVTVVDSRGRHLGIGLYNGRSRIRVRVLSRDAVSIDADFLERRIRAALSVRERLLPDATCYRLLSSEADRVSGVIIDRYDDVLVLQLSSLGMAQRRAQIVTALECAIAANVIVERIDAAARRFEGMDESTGVLRGELSGSVAVRINGLSFEADVIGGHKTGLYLDQQVNYREVARLLSVRPQARVLDCFSFAGGFGLHCARAGAAQVTLVDQSAEAIEAARRNASANALLEKCEFVVGNVFDWLKSMTVLRQRDGSAGYDLIVLDPPPFAPNRAAVRGALRGYKEIHLRALKLLAPGGVLATFCCSYHVDADQFEQTILAAARDVQVTLRRIARYTQSPDHPVIPAIPETEYLKGYAYELLD